MLHEEIDRADASPGARDQASRRLDVIKDKEPPLDVPATTCLNAWWQLDSTRHVGMAGAGAIPFPSIVFWCEFYGAHLDREATLVVIAVIEQLDRDRAQRIAAEQALRQVGAS